MNERLSAAAVHLLTATGAAFALLALIAAAHGDWQWMFIWLGVALIVDTIDGPLARRVGVTRVLPRWSGERLDLIVDFLTYTAVPAFALSQADLLPEAYRLPAGIAVMMSSLFHMADQDSKTKEGYFVGFPAIWNVVCLYLFAFMPHPFVSLAIVTVFVVLDLRADPLRAPVSRGGAARLQRGCHRPVARGGDRRGRQSLSLAALGEGASGGNRLMPYWGRRHSFAGPKEGIVTVRSERGTPLDLYAISPDLGAGRLIPPKRN